MAALSDSRVIVVHRGLDSGGYRQILPRAGQLDVSVKLHQSSLMTADYPVTGWVADAVLGHDETSTKPVQARLSLAAPSLDAGHECTKRSQRGGKLVTL